MKRFCVMLSVCLLVTLLSLLPVNGEGETSVKVYVTVSNKGELAMAAREITVTDADADGVITVSDALFAAHEAAYNGGAAAGYEAYVGDYGLSLSRLWGDNSGAYGYYLNNASCLSLASPVANGNYVAAFVYKDTMSFADLYCYFDRLSAEAEQGGEITLTLTSLGYNENWETVTLPVQGAEITVNGMPTGLFTNEEGKVTLAALESGELLISARSSEQELVPPVCRLSVAGDVAATDASTNADAANTAGCRGRVEPVAMLPALLGGLIIWRKRGEQA